MFSKRADAEIRMANSCSKTDHKHGIIYQMVVPQGIKHRDSEPMPYCISTIFSSLSARSTQSNSAMVMTILPQYLAVMTLVFFLWLCFCGGGLSSVTYNLVT